LGRKVFGKDIYPVAFRKAMSHAKYKLLYRLLVEWKEYLDSAEGTKHVEEGISEPIKYTCSWSGVDLPMSVCSI